MGQRESDREDQADKVRDMRMGKEEAEVTEERLKSEEIDCKKERERERERERDNERER